MIEYTVRFVCDDCGKVIEYTDPNFTVVLNALTLAKKTNTVVLMTGENTKQVCSDCDPSKDAHLRYR